MTSITSLTSAATRFRALHDRAGCFVIPNPWDVGSARLLASFGFEALATTSAGFAFSLGVRDGAPTREQVLEHCRSLVAATDLPVSADLENGFADSPEGVAETVRLARETGLAGCSIEDYTNRREDPIYDFALSVERVEAAVEAARSGGGDFVLTARAENLLCGRDDLDDTIRRLQAFEAAGADVLYAPGLHDIDSVRAVTSALSKPVNVVMGMPGATLEVGELAAARVKRISLGSAFFRAALGEFLRAVTEVQNEGRFSFAARAVGFAEIEAHFAPFEARDQLRDGA